MIQLSDHFNYKRLLHFTFPTIIMLIISSIYGVVDGYFVSNFIGKIPFTAINFVMPFLLILGCTGFLFGTGGGALIAKTMGEGKREKASKQFSLLIYTSAIFGIILAVFGIIVLRWIISVLGAEGQLLEDSITYGQVVLLAIPAYILQCEFQCLFATAEKPKLGLYVAIGAGITNIILDFLFIVVFKWGLVGAAAATAIGQFIGGIVPVIYFVRPNGSLLRLTKTNFDGIALLKTISNGSSELLTNISTSVVSMLYNVQLLKYAANVREDLMPQFKMEGTFVADVPAINKKGIEFKIYYISPLGSFATWKSTKQTGSYDLRTFEIHARPTQKVDDLRPGMSVLLTLNE